MMNGDGRTNGKVSKLLTKRSKYLRKTFKLSRKFIQSISQFLHFSSLLASGLESMLWLKHPSNSHHILTLVIQEKYSPKELHNCSSNAQHPVWSVSAMKLVPCGALIILIIKIQWLSIGGRDFAGVSGSEYH